MRTDTERVEWFERVRPHVSYHWRADESTDKPDRVVLGGSGWLTELFRDWDVSKSHMRTLPRTWRDAVDLAIEAEPPSAEGSA